jgi:hypothetical protein
MAQDRTSGYDVLLQISESEINSQLETQFVAGGPIPTSMSIPVTASGLSGTATVLFGTPTADLDRPRPQMGLTLPFHDSQFAVTTPIPITLAPLGGTILVVQPIEVLTQGSNQIVSLNFNDAMPAVTVTFDSASATVLAPALAAAGLTLGQAQNLVAGAIVTQLQGPVGRFDLTPPIPVVDDNDPTTVFDIDATTINDTSGPDRNCVVFGVKMSSATVGNIGTATTNFIPVGQESLVMLSNAWLLGQVLRPKVATALGIPLSALDAPLHLNRSVNAPGGQGTLTNLDAQIDGNRIRVNARATASGTGWSAVSNITFFIDLALSGGSITVTSSTPSVDTSVDLEWWVWLLSIGLGGLFGGIVGAIVGAIVPAIVEAVASGMVNSLVSGAITSGIGNIPPLPLGPIGSGLTLDAIILDDLELHGSIIRSLSIPIRNQGSYESPSGFSIDLDTGHVTASATSLSDLTWNPGHNLQTAGPARLTITGISYGALTPVQVSKMPLIGMSISAGSIPYSFPVWIPFVSHPSITFGVRTSAGRLAKVEAYYDLGEGGMLHLDWVVWDTPVPSVDISSSWTVIERGDVTNYVKPDCSYCTSSPVRWCGLFEAVPKLMPFPIDYQWCLCGTVLADGEGEVSSAGGNLRYKVKGKQLMIQSETLGEDIDCQLCLSAIDERGLEQFKCISLNQPGIQTTCKPCQPANYQIAYLPAAAELADWRPLLSAVQKAPG